MKYNTFPTERKYHYWRGFRSALLLAILAFGIYALFTYVIYPPDYTMSPSQYQDYLAQPPMTQPAPLNTSTFSVASPVVKTYTLPKTKSTLVGRGEPAVATPSSADEIKAEQDHDLCVKLQMANGEMARGAIASEVNQCITSEVALIRSKIASGKGNSVMTSVVAEATTDGY